MTSYLLPSGVMVYSYDGDGDTTDWTVVHPPVAADPMPEVPPPCWDARPISGEACVAATRAMCG